jgi:hypothetical protein
MQTQLKRIFLLTVPPSTASIDIVMKHHFILTIKHILNRMFPYQEPPSRVSVLIQDSWLERIMHTPALKDYLSSK